MRSTTAVWTAASRLDASRISRITISRFASSSDAAGAGDIDHDAAVPHQAPPGDRLPTATEAGLLQVPRSRPLWVCENVNLAGVVVEFGISHYPSTREQVTFEP